MGDQRDNRFLERVKSKGMIIYGSLKGIELTVNWPKNFTPPLALLDSMEGFVVPVTCSISVHVKMIASLRVAG